MKVVVSDNKITPHYAQDIFRKGVDLDSFDLTISLSVVSDPASKERTDLRTDTNNEMLTEALITGKASLLLTRREFAVLAAIYNLSTEEREGFSSDREISRWIENDTTSEYVRDRTSVYKNLITLGLVERRNPGMKEELRTTQLCSIVISEGAIGVVRFLSNTNNPKLCVDTSKGISEDARKLLISKRSA